VKKAAESTPPSAPAKKPAALKQVAPKETALQKAPPKKPAPPKPKKSQPADKKADKAAPKTQAAPVDPASAAAHPSQRLGPHMTPDDAIRIALDAAPPSRSVEAYPVNYHGIHAYQVVFKTEDGDRSIFVDRETGKIVK
jgi:hypothetical protein